MTIQHKDDGKKGVFFIAGDKNAEPLAQMVYQWSSPNLFVIEHTEVNKELEGQGIGKKLLQQAVDFAKEKEVKIHPTCAFAKAIMEKTPDYQDVLT